MHGIISSSHSPLTSPPYLISLPTPLSPSLTSSPSDDPVRFQEDLMHIACTTLSSKILTQHRDLFARLAVEAVLRLKGSGSLDAIKIIKKLGGNLQDSYLEEGTMQ